MARVIRDLDTYEVDAYMPMRELHDKQTREIYQAAGTWIMKLHDKNGTFRSAYDLLIILEDDRQVSFSCGMARNAEALN